MANLQFFAVKTLTFQFVRASKYHLEPAIDFCLFLNRDRVILHWRKIELIFGMLTGYFKRLLHRVNTPRGEKGGGRGFFCQFEPNFPLPYCTVHSWGMSGWRAGSPVAVQYMREHNAQSLNQFKQKVQLNKDGALCPSGYD